MFIAVVIQLRGLACGVILTTQMSSMVLAFFGFASALLLSKPGAPITFSSTSRYLSMFHARTSHWRWELLGGYRSSIHRILAAFANLSASSTRKLEHGLGQMVFHSDIWLKKDLGTGSGLPQFCVLQNMHNFNGGPPKKENHVFILGLKIGVN